VGAEGRERWREDGRGRPWVGPDGCRPTRRAGRIGGGLRRVRSLSAAPGTRLLTFCNPYGTYAYSGICVVGVRRPPEGGWG
jgi:hypothetical protein